MLTRRALVGKLAVGTVGAAAVLVGGAKGAKAAINLDEIPPAESDGVQRRALAGSSAEAPGQVSLPAQAGDSAGALASESSSAPWELLHPLTAGALVTHGWRVAELSPVVHGACVLTLQNQRGRTHRVHMCRNDGTPQGLVYTERLDLVVMNGGQGDLPTDEGLAQAVAEVAHVLAVNEERREQQPLVVALLPHAERLQRYGAGADAKLR